MRRSLSLIVVAAVLAAACSTVKVSTGADSRVDFSRYRTFAFTEETAAATNPVAGVLRSSVARELDARGLRPVTTDPDLLVATYGQLRGAVRWEHAAYAPYGGWSGWSGWDWSGSVVVGRDITVGTVLVDLVDAGTGQLVWRGVAQGALRDVARPEERIERLERTVARVLRDYPPR